MLKIYNTFTRKKEIFKPLKDKRVGMYVCGPTVYGPSHIGHARTYIVFDVIRRYLEYKNYKVNFISNITDIHDDIIKESLKQEVDFLDLASRYIKLFFDDLEKLKIKKANKNPRVTEHIEEIKKIIADLIKKEFAYEKDGSVYFNISKFKDYGKLSGVEVKKSITGTRVKTDKYEKEEVSDFVLWKKAKFGEPSWESPWGRGRPGWHIECSAMSKKYLGEQFDIHGGAKDLIFPHHENEIAQSEAATGIKPFVKYWMHSGPLTVDGQKMSRSAENYIEIPNLLKKHDAQTIRFFMLSAHWRSPLDYTEKAIKQAQKNSMRLKEFLSNLKKIKSSPSLVIIDTQLDKAKGSFESAMDDDFNTPKALAAIFKIINEVNPLIAESRVGKSDAEKIIKLIKKFNGVLEIIPDKPVQKTKIPAEVEKLVREREKYRKEKNWQRADKVRDKIQKMGYVVEDTPKGPTIKTISDK